MNQRAQSVPSEYARSTVASQRLRVAIPSFSLAQAGFTQSIANLQATFDFNALPTAHSSLAIFSKILGNSGMQVHLEQHVALARNLCSARIPILIDICDNPFIGITAPYMERLFAFCTQVTVNSPAMADIVATHTDFRPRVIPDPVEGIRHAPQFDPPRRTRWWNLLSRQIQRPLIILWFGGPLRSFESLRLTLPILFDLAQHQPIDLHLVTADSSEVKTEIERIRRTQRTGFTVRFTQWSLESLSTALENSDMVVLPGEASDPSKIGVSTNRLTESIWAGRIVVASGLPSYWEFKECAYIGDDIARGIRLALTNPPEARRRIANGQARVAIHYTPEAIGKLWVNLCTELIQR